MLTRIRKEMDKKEEGFTLIELLVVMIIIGILAAIAIPVFLNQRKKAQDSAAKADVSTIGKEVATYYVDAADGGTVTVTVAAGRYVLNGSDGSTPAVVVANLDLGKASANVALDATSGMDKSDTWCVSVKNLKGDKAVAGFKYSAAGGLEDGVCP